MGVLHPTRRKNKGGNLGRNLEMSERRRALARKKRRKKRAMRKAARMKHQAARARSRLEELTFGTFNVRTVNGIGHIKNQRSLRCPAPPPDACEDILGFPQKLDEGG